jgi:hypothetical protein
VDLWESAVLSSATRASSAVGLAQDNSRGIA